MALKRYALCFEWLTHVLPFNFHRQKTIGSRKDVFRVFKVYKHIDIQAKCIKCTAEYNHLYKSKLNMRALNLMLVLFE